MWPRLLPISSYRKCANVEKPIAIIPARAGSVRIPGKNIRPFFGKPIIAYSIDAALRSKLFSQIIVSTDSEETAAIAFRCGATPYMRPADYCDGETGTQEVVAQYVATLKHPPMFVCTIYATAPLLRSRDLMTGYKLMEKCDCHFALGVQASPLQDAGQFYWSWVPGLLRGDPLIGLKTGLVPIPENRICDINTPDDWARAEKLYLQLMESER